MKILLDSSALIEYYFGTPLGEEVRKHIENSEVVFVPGIILGETISKLIRMGHNPSPIISVANQYAVPLDAPEYYIEAGKRHAEMRKKGLNVSLIDVLLLVLAEMNHTKLLTKDSVLVGTNTILLK